MFASAMLDGLFHSVKVVARFFLGIAIGTVAIFGFAVVSGTIPASELTLDNARSIVAEVRAKVDEVTEFWNELDPSVVGMLSQAYGGGVDDTYAGPDYDEEEEEDDYGSLDSWGGFEEYVARGRDGR